MGMECYLFTWIQTTGNIASTKFKQLKKKFQLTLWTPQRHQYNRCWLVRQNNHLSIQEFKKFMQSRLTSWAQCAYCWMDVVVVYGSGVRMILMNCLKPRVLLNYNFIEWLHPRISQLTVRAASSESLDAGRMLSQHCHLAATKHLEWGFYSTRRASGPTVLRDLEATHELMASWSSKYPKFRRESAAVIELSAAGCNLMKQFVLQLDWTSGGRQAGRQGGREEGVHQLARPSLKMTEHLRR